MSRSRRTHYDDTPPDATDGTRSLLCGRVASLTAQYTRDAAEVDCRECRARLDARGQEVETAPALDPLAMPYEGRTSALGRREAAIVAASIAGEEQREGPRWSSIDRALEHWVRVMDDGAPIRSTFRAEAPVQSSSAPRVLGGREDVLAVTRAMEGAYREDRSFGQATLTVAVQRQILEWRMVGRPVQQTVAPGRKGKILRRVPVSHEQLAAALTKELGARVTERHVQIVEAHGRERVYEALVAAGEVEPGHVGRIPYDALVGIAAIAEVLGVTPATAARYLDRAPIRRAMRRGRAVHWTIEVELRAWMERTRGPWTWELLGAS